MVGMLMMDRLRKKTPSSLLTSLDSLSRIDFDLYGYSCECLLLGPGMDEPPASS